MYRRIVKLPIGNRSFFLFGPRQTGKSTLIQSLIRDLPNLSVNFLQRDIFLKYKSRPEQLRREIEVLLSGSPLTVFIDEVQKIPEILDEVHFLLEKYQDKILFILTGSSARKLRRSSANLLAGRAWQFSLYPLTHLELGNDFQLEKALSRGALPPLIREEDEAATKTLSAYTQTYLKEEILDEALTRNIAAFSQFLALAADQSGQLVSYTDFARETHVSAKTIQAYYQILEDTLIAFRLPPFIKSARKRLVQHPKYYLFDIGIIHSLLGRPVGPLPQGTFEFGRAFEHFIILEILRLASYLEKSWRFYHWRTSQGAEVDLIIESHDMLWALEIKSSERPERNDLRGLRSFLEDYPQAKPLCVSQASQPYQLGDINVLPWRMLFGAAYLDLTRE